MELRDAENILIVEGDDDKFAFIGLMEHHIAWPDKAPWPVFVASAGGVTNLLKKAYLSSIMKADKAKRIGIVVDADGRAPDQPGSAADRYRAVQNLCRELFPNLPANLPAQGLVIENDGKRLGLWVMPDNNRTGIMEEFLIPLVPEAQAEIWAHAQQSVEDAIVKGANCGTEREKARLYTFLAWQQEPGRSPGQALSKKHLDAMRPEALPFIAWFKSVFQL